MIVETTCGSLNEAKAMARKLVEGRRVVCCHLFPITSCYRWQGAIEETEEVVVRCTTTKKRVEEVITFLKANHSYKVPAIIVTTAESRNKEYSDWVEKEGQDG